jgi:hypothetical protein
MPAAAVALVTATAHRVCVDSFSLVSGVSTVEFQSSVHHLTLVTEMRFVSMEAKYLIIITYIGFPRQSLYCVLFMLSLNVRLI